MSSDAITPGQSKKSITVHYTTDAVPEHRRAAYWSDALARTFAGAEASVPVGRCRGRIRTSRLGPVQVVTVEGGPVWIRRPAQPAESLQDGCLMVMSLLEGSAVVSQGYRETHVQPGETVFHDATHPMRIGFTGTFRAACLIFPRGLIGLTETHLKRVPATPISRCAPSASLLSPLLARLGDTVPKLPPGTSEVLVRHVVGLLSVLAEERLPEEAGLPQAAQDLLSRIKAYIDQRLGDPDLTPLSIAQTHHISTRYLHKLFEYEDTTASRWIQRRRLERCRRELARRGSAGMTISAVARQFGFSSAAHFSRTFRRMYGMSPAEWRDKALRDGEPTSSEGAATHRAGVEPRVAHPALFPARRTSGTVAA
ncbi:MULTISPECIES: helix-turn-helix domain-containing protein [Streptomyces]|uniref:AraC family transcriptional regulator n=1 Tax=Streptomyces canarius TaxID=285453 RepID=A0ABQ3DCQ0_9ACTN|nr:helix-turn-helix domain-containing protein [Streptomyces canarius]GHA77125.1 AraC family transcriptional regulator [Streptomyces canarius]